MLVFGHVRKVPIVARKSHGRPLGGNAYENVDKIRGFDNDKCPFCCLDALIIIRSTVVAKTHTHFVNVWRTFVRLGYCILLLVRNDLKYLVNCLPNVSTQSILAPSAVVVQSAVHIAQFLVATRMAVNETFDESFRRTFQWLVAKIEYSHP